MSWEFGAAVAAIVVTHHPELDGRRLRRVRGADAAHAELDVEAGAPPAQRRADELHDEQLGRRGLRRRRLCALRKHELEGTLHDCRLLVPLR